MQSKPLLSVIFALSATVCAGCGGPAPQPAEPAGPIGAALAGAPPWVLLGCDAHDEAPPNAICGVGSVQATRNVAMARSAAQGRARTDIARQLTVGVQSMLEDYYATVTDWEAVEDEQNIVEVSRQLVDLSLSGSRQLDAWVSPVDDTLHVLMILDFERVTAAIDGMDRLSPTVRLAIQQRAADALRRMDTEAAQ